MKYSFGNVTDVEGKIYRDCLFVNLKTFKIQDHPDDFEGDPKNLIITDEDIPKDCIVVDALMAPIVLELNKKGYRTVYSCQGYLEHIYKREESKKYCTNVTSTYVIFETPYTDRYLKNIFNLPRQFDVRIENVGFPDINEAIEKIYGIHREKRCNKRVLIYSSMPFCLNNGSVDREMFDKYTKADMLCLASWATGLPDLNEEPIEKSNALYDERIIDKDTARQCGFEFESVQEFASDIKECHDVMVESIDTINREMTMLNDMVESISARLSNLRLVDDIRNE